jgi:hypothetical protein
MLDAAMKLNDLSLSLPHRVVAEVAGRLDPLSLPGAEPKRPFVRRAFRNQNWYLMKAWA